MGGGAAIRPGREGVLGPASVCGDGAPIERIMPTTFGTETGAVTGVPSSSRPRPVGLLCSDTVATRGVMSRVTVLVRPDESRTVRLNR